jgi:hypothetical protein
MRKDNNRLENHDLSFKIGKMIAKMIDDQSPLSASLLFRSIAINSHVFSDFEDMDFLILSH